MSVKSEFYVLEHVPLARSLMLILVPVNVFQLDITMILLTQVATLALSTAILVIPMEVAFLAAQLLIIDN